MVSVACGNLQDHSACLVGGDGNVAILGSNGSISGLGSLANHVGNGSGTHGVSNSDFHLSIVVANGVSIGFGLQSYGDGGIVDGEGCLGNFTVIHSNLGSLGINLAAVVNGQGVALGPVLTVKAVIEFSALGRCSDGHFLSSGKLTTVRSDRRRSNLLGLLEFDRINLRSLAISTHEANHVFILTILIGDAIISVKEAIGDSAFAIGPSSGISLSVDGDIIQNDVLALVGSGQRYTSAVKRHHRGSAVGGDIGGIGDFNPVGTILSGAARPTGSQDVTSI